MLALTTTTTTPPYNTNNNRNHNEVQYGILHATVCCQVPVPPLVDLAVHIFPEQVHQWCQQLRLLPLQHFLMRAHQHIDGSAMTSQLVHSVLTGGRRTVERPAAVLPRVGVVVPAHTQQQQQHGVVSCATIPASAAKVSAATTTTTTTTSQYHASTVINDDDNEDDGHANDLLPLFFSSIDGVDPVPRTKLPRIQRQHQEQQ